MGWRISSTPTITVSTPHTARTPRSALLRLSAASSSTMPSTSTKTPAITAKVARLSLGLARMRTPAITLRQPTRSTSHHADTQSRPLSCSELTSDMTDPPGLRCGGDLRDAEQRVPAGEVGKDHELSLGAVAVVRSVAGPAQR